MNRLQTVNLRFCGAADQALARLRGALPAGRMSLLIFYINHMMEYMLIICYNTNADKLTRKALDELSDLFTYLRVWRIEKHVYIDVLMPPTESYHRDLFFQVSYLRLL